jgi:GTP cyclohydrolase I
MLTFAAERWDAMERLGNEVAAGLMRSLENGEPIAIQCRSEHEARLMRVRVSSLGYRRIEINAWYYIATKHTRVEPLMVYAWIEKCDADCVSFRLRRLPARKVITSVGRQTFRQRARHRDREHRRGR